MGPHFRQTPTYYLKRHQTHLIVGWKPFMRRNYVMAARSAVCRLISILLVKLSHVQYVIALPWKQYGQLIFLTLGVFSWLLHSSVGLKLKSVMLLKTKRSRSVSVVSKLWPNVEILCFHVFFFFVDGKQVLWGFVNFLWPRPEFRLLQILTASK